MPVKHGIRVPGLPEGATYEPPEKPVPTLILGPSGHKTVAVGDEIAAFLAPIPMLALTMWLWLPGQPKDEFSVGLEVTSIDGIVNKLEHIPLNGGLNAVPGSEMQAGDRIRLIAEHEGEVWYTALFGVYR